MKDFVLLQNKTLVGDFHFILEYDAISQVWNKFIDKTFLARPNVLDVLHFMRTCNLKLLRKLCIF